MDSEPDLKKFKYQECNEDSWDCATCTYKNSKESFRCAICLTRKGTSTRKTKVNCDVISQQELIQQTIVSRKKSSRPLCAARIPKLKNVDRSRPYFVEVFANGFSVVITEFKPKLSKVSLPFHFLNYVRLIHHVICE
ncbi:hypothetical protein Ciccas_011574 [Cichlidogyrus casuarinus]|uniref:RanBP2-type domain-containing protein n=1 Tax=Cichlidogyrus casuarinus TaxID=1844966 RepID=A0ABD2PQV1_9PLAT